MTRRGTTPTHTFKPKTKAGEPVDLTSAQVVYMTYKQNDRVVFEKTIPLSYSLTCCGTHRGVPWDKGAVAHLGAEAKRAALQMQQPALSLAWLGSRAVDIPAQLLHDGWEVRSSGLKKQFS